MTRARIKRATIASTVGTALEWYDFSLYGTAAALVLPAVFFPTADPVVATLSSLATFAIGFFARPVGGVLIGVLGDRFGRRQMLFVTLLLMAASSVLIGVLPTYAQVGVLAPALLVFLRILQGLGAGGEYAGAMLLSAEHSGKTTRGLNASIPSVGNAMGSLVATGIFFLFEAVLSDEAFLAWGWRVPFLLSIVLSIAAFIIRLKVEDSPEFTREMNLRGVVRMPFRTMFKLSGRRVPLAMLMSIAPNILSYLPSVYALTYLASTVGAPAWIGLVGIIIANLLKLVTVPTAGWLSDKFGARRIMMIGSVAGAILFFPFFFMLDTGTPLVVWAALVMIFTLCCDLTLASQASMMSTLFHVRVRYTAVTFSREITGALVGGTIPFVAAWLTSVGSGSPWLVCVFCAAMCLICAVGTYFLPSTEADDEVHSEESVRQHR
ncbi:MFS transporter [Paramicrobacterium chengjingii]|uniref:MHS family MFS transporter n=1 Tax=Paramicrobacterium chengjingii TaxID=2769067 RepID=A0ABX6YIM3_9MICO|nr:MFS transporter [Microbacterium chengjingii]QPZ38192.1 MHS family MFS transporter [Microbacterium chengjingii]